MTKSGESAFLIQQARPIVREMLTPRLGIYWTDFLVTIATAYLGLSVFLGAEDYGLVPATAFVVSALAFFRAVVFIHEIAHRREKSFDGFKLVWNLLCGIPVLMPSFLYGDHKSHHASRSYGTDDDAEYLIGRGPTRASAFLLLAIVYPLLGWLRFLLLTPVVLVSRGFDRPVWRRLSSLYMMNPRYRREYDRMANSRERWLQEIACCVWSWTIAAMLWSGIVPSGAAWRIYCVFLFWIAINQVRTLAAHRYSSGGEGLPHVSQVLDSNTFGSGFSAELWAPVGMRYHALHHLFPSLPYHSMRKAHERLVAELPPDSPYRRTLQPSLWAALRQAFSSDSVHRRAPDGKFAQSATEI
jgi:fatty acid desaturase